MNFKKSRKNLRVESGYVISYTTRVAKINGETLDQLGWWSVTTQRHINYAAQELGLKLNRNGY